jgi:hypothetical protein
MSPAVELNRKIGTFANDRKPVAAGRLAGILTGDVEPQGDSHARDTVEPKTRRTFPGIRCGVRRARSIVPVQSRGGGNQPRFVKLLLGDAATDRLLGLEQTGAYITRLHGRRLEHLPEKAGIGAHAFDFRALERLLQSRKRGRAVRRPGNHLGDHRIVVHRDFVAFVDACVDAHMLDMLRKAQPT